MCIRDSLSGKYAVLVRDNLHSGSTGCQGAAALSTTAGSGGGDHGGVLTQDPSGKWSTTFHLDNQGADGRTEEELDDGVHTDLQGTAAVTSTFTLCIADADDRDQDSDFTHYGNIKLFSQHLPPSPPPPSPPPLSLIHISEPTRPY